MPNVGIPPEEREHDVHVRRIFFPRSWLVIQERRTLGSVAVPKLPQRGSGITHNRLVSEKRG